MVVRSAPLLYTLRARLTRARALPFGGPRLRINSLTQREAMVPVETVQTFVAPVVMISANGLLALAFYNRLAAVVGRSRAINKERFELVTRLARLERRADHPEPAHLKRRIEVLDELGHELFERAHLVCGTLICLLVSVLFMLACSLALGLSPLGSAVGWAAMGFFVAGALAMATGLVLAIRELRVSLEPLLWEHERIEQ